MKRALLFVLAAGLSSACASAQAKAPADRPTLEVPAPPARSIEPTPKPEPSTAAPEPVGHLPPASPTASNPPTRPAVRDNTPRSEPKPAEPPPSDPPAAAAPPPAPISPAPQLRTPSSADGPEASKQVRDMIDKAKNALYSIDFKKLNNARQEQYNNAQLMLQKAEEQLKTSNFDLARENADKAYRLANELQGRGR